LSFPLWPEDGNAKNTKIARIGAFMTADVVTEENVDNPLNGS
jgi:hypothetical protein